MTISVVIADDDVSIREAVAELLADEPDLELLGTATEPEQAIELCLRRRPDVALIDVRMPGGGGRRIAQALREGGLETRIVVLSALETPAVVREMLRMGACGYVVKGASGALILEAVRRAARGQLSVSADLAITAFGELVRDADAWRQAEARLREIEQRFLALLDAAPVAALLFDPSGGIQLANMRAVEMLGCLRTDLVGRSVEDLVPDDQRETLAAACRRVLEEPATRATRLEAIRSGRRHDGAEFPAEVTVVRIRGAEPLGLVIVNDETHLRQAERAARAGEDRALGLLGAAPDAMVVVNEQGRIELVNERAEALFGYQREALLGRPVEVLIPADARRHHVGLRAAYVSDPRLRPGEQLPGLKARRKDGAVIAVEVSLSPLRTPTGTLVLATVRDVGRQREREEALLRSDERHRSILDATPDGIVVVDAAGVIQMINAQAEHLFEYPRAELVGRSVDELLPAALASGHARQRARYALDPQVRPMGTGLRTSGRRRDGGEFSAFVSLSPLETDEGPLVVAAVRDISEPLRRFDLQREEELRFRRLMDTSSDGVLIVDAQGLMLETNTQLQEMFAYGADELAGRPVEMLIPDRFSPAHAGDRAQYLGSPRPRPMGIGLELSGRRRDGSEFPVDVSLAPISESGGERTIARIRDMTERRQAERERLLSQLVRAQENERLRIASDIHDDTIQAVSAARLRLERLRRRLTNDGQREELHKLDAVVETAINRLRHLMFELRPPALAEEGLVAALRGYLEQIKIETGLRHELVSHVEREPSPETSVLLYRTFQELLVNVRKHAQAASVRVEVRESDGGYELVVADDGRGFEEGEPETRPGHPGFVALQERTRAVGGHCRFGNGPYGGAVVQVWVPGPGLPRPGTGPDV